jgi:hypothetical protein
MTSRVGRSRTQQQSFIDWLLDQTERDDCIGRLAECASVDELVWSKPWPRFWSRPAYLAWLQQSGGTERDLKTLTEAWIEWCNDPAGLKRGRSDTIPTSAGNEVSSVQRRTGPGVCGSDVDPEGGTGERANTDASVLG